MALEPIAISVTCFFMNSLLLCLSNFARDTLYKTTPNIAKSTNNTWKRTCSLIVGKIFDWKIIVPSRNRRLSWWNNETAAPLTVRTVLLHRLFPIFFCFLSFRDTPVWKRKENKKKTYLLATKLPCYLVVLSAGTANKFQRSFSMFSLRFHSSMKRVASNTERKRGN